MSGKPGLLRLADRFIAGDGAEPYHGKRSTYIRKKCRCIPCTDAENTYQQNRRRDRPDVAAAQDERAKRWARANRDLINERQRAERRVNPEPSRRKVRKHYHANKGHYAEANRKWRLNNPEAWKAKSRRGWDAWSARNPEAVVESKRRWAAANVEAQNENTRRRRARIRQVTIVDFTIEQLSARMAMWPGCWICGGPKEAVDHVKPLARGGLHTLANLRPVCQPCNSSKSARWYGVAWAAQLSGNRALLSWWVPA